MYFENKILFFFSQNGLRQNVYKASLIIHIVCGFYQGFLKVVSANSRHWYKPISNIL